MNILTELYEKTPNVTFPDQKSGASKMIFDVFYSYLTEFIESNHESFIYQAY